MSNIEKKVHYGVKGCGIAQASIKDIDEAGRTVRGFYNTFNFLDSDGDILLPGCAKKSIRERGPKSNAVAKIKHALNHDLTQLPGKIMVLEEREEDGIHGIYFETRMADTTLGNDVLKNYLAGIYDNHSIGFRYMATEFVERDAKGWDKLLGQIRNPEDMGKSNYVVAVKEIQLFEGSTVAFGANSLTPVLGVKSRDKALLKLTLLSQVEKINKAVRGGTQSDEMLETLELQCLQLKQMITDLAETETAAPPHTEKKQEKQPEPVKSEGLSLASVEAFKFD